MDRRYVLSIDGGGIRGILPACLLVELERVTGRLARETFSFAAGTSTGAIIAAGVAAGLPATRILDIYRNRAREIFVRTPFTPLKRIVRGYQYENRTLARVMAEELGPHGDWTLNDAPIDVMFTATRVSDGMPWYFVRDNPANARSTGKLPMVDCVTASACAPTYFEPWVISQAAGGRSSNGEPIGALVDGGVGVAGNPVYQTCVEAFFYNTNYQPEATIVVSLGTGRFVERRQPTWIWPWFQWTLGQLMRSPGEQQTQLVQRHFSSTPLYRLDPDLQQLDPMLTNPIELDDVGSVDVLLEYGRRFAEKVNWHRILEDNDESFRIHRHNTLWKQYKQS
jgi:predicted acylesterase/phospholipase RssA